MTKILILTLLLAFISITCIMIAEQKGKKYLKNKPKEKSVYSDFEIISILIIGIINFILSILYLNDLLSTNSGTTFLLFISTIFIIILLIEIFKLYSITDIFIKNNINKKKAYIPIINYYEECRIRKIKFNPFIPIGINLFFIPSIIFYLYMVIKQSEINYSLLILIIVIIYIIIAFSNTTSDDNNTDSNTSYDNITDNSKKIKEKAPKKNKAKEIKIEKDKYNITSKCNFKVYGTLEIIMLISMPFILELTIINGISNAFSTYSGVYRRLVYTPELTILIIILLIFLVLKIIKLTIIGSQFKEKNFDFIAAFIPVYNYYVECEIKNKKFHILTPIIIEMALLPLKLLYLFIINFI